jgi:hypothetical protein
MIQNDLFHDYDPPVHRLAHRSELRAAQRAVGSARSQKRLILELIVTAGEEGISNRELQLALFSPSVPAWNKVPTRTKALRDDGLVCLRYDLEGCAAVRFNDGVHTIINYPTRAGRATLEAHHG